MSTTTETLLNRIQKLLALTSSPNEHEAQAAALKVQELLATYGLEMAEVQAHQAKTDTTSPIAAPRVKEGLRSSAMYSYQQDLMRSIARNNFCYYMLTERAKEDPRAKGGRRWVKTHTLIGSHLNVTVATLLYEYLTETMDRLLPYQGMEKRGKSALLWLAGCSDRLQERLTEQRDAQDAKAEQAKGDGRSLVTLADVRTTEDDLNVDFQYGWEPGTTAAHRAKWAAEQAEKAERNTEWSATLDNQKKETDAQRRKREQKEERQEQRWRDQYRRQWEKRYNKTRSAEYRSGAKTANDIGLDKQVDHAPKTMLD